MALAPLVIMVFVIGLFPSIFLDRMKASVQLTYAQFRDVSEYTIQHSDEHGVKLLPAELFSPAFLKGAPASKEEKKAEPSAALEGGAK